MGAEEDFDSKRMSEMRKKLEALNYTEELELGSLPLAEHLVGDLIHTTESYRAVKIKNTRLSQELEAERQKIDVLKKDNGRLLTENNQLHLRILHEAEMTSATERLKAVSWKKMEDELSNLRFVKSQFEERVSTLEKENASLQARVKELLQLAKDNLPEDTSKVDINYFRQITTSESSPSGIRTSAQSNGNDRARHDNQRVANHQSELERELSSMRERQAELSSLLALSEEKLLGRDMEIQRLSSLLENGRIVDHLMLEYRNNAAKETIASLNHQVDFLSSQLATSEESMAEKRQLEVALRRLQGEKVELENSLREALAENAKVYEEVNGIQELIQKLQGEPPPDVTTRPGAFGDATELDQLKRARADLLGRMTDLRQTVAVGEREQLRLQYECGRLQERVNSLEVAVHTLESDKMNKEEELLDAKQQAEEAEAKCASLSQSLLLSQEEVRAWERRVQASADTATRLEEDLQDGRAQLASLQQNLRNAKDAALEYEDKLGKMQRKQDELVDHLQRVELQHNVVSADRDELQQTIKQQRQEKLRMAAELAAAEEDRDRHHRLAASLREELSLGKVKGERLESSYVHHDLQLSKASAEIEALKGENAVLKEQLGNSASKLNRAEAQQLAHAHNCEHLQVLQPKIEHLQKRVEELEAQVLEKELALVRSRSEISSKAEELRFINDEKAALAETLEETQRERAELAEQIKEYDAQVHKVQASVLSITAQRDASLSLQAKLAGELEDYKARNQEMRLAANSSAASVDKVERKCAALERQLAALENEKEQATKQLDVVHQGTEASRMKEDELRRKITTLLNELEVCHAGSEQQKEEIEELRTEQEKLHAKVAAGIAELQQCRKELSNSERDVEQLKTLITQLDATREELVAKLRAALAERRVSEAQVAALEKEKQLLAEEADKRKHEKDELHTVVGALDAERDQMQSEVDMRAEEITRLTQENATWQEAAIEAKRSLGVAEGKLHATETKAKQAELEILSLREQLSIAQERLRNLQEECAVKGGELRNVGDDLGAVTREHQLLAKELDKTATERDALRAELREATAKISFAEQLIQSKERELSDILRSLQKMSEEHQRNVMAAEQADYQIHAYRLQQVGLEESLKSAQEHIKGLEDESIRYVSDLQALEQQADSLSRSLTQQARIMEDQQQEKATLVGQLSAAKQVSMELELSRNSIQRDLAGAEARLRTFQMRIDESAKEIDSMNVRYTMEHNRVKELEQLLACVRIQGQHQNIGHLDGGSRESHLHERLQVAEKQVSALQHQVQTLQSMRDAQSREISRLQAKVTQTAVESSLSSPRLATGGREEEGEAGPSGRPPSRGDSSRPMTAGERVRVQQLEARAVSLAGELAKVSSKYSDCQLQLQQAQSMYNSAREENERMLVLLSKLDEERTQLQHRRSSVVGDTPGEHRSNPSSPTKESLLQGECTRLQKALESSEEQRQVLENNFQELMTSVEGFNADSGRDALTNELQARLNDLRVENRRLRDNLETTTAACNEAEAKVHRLRQAGPSVSTLYGRGRGDTMSATKTGTSAP